MDKGYPLRSNMTIAEMCESNRAFQEKKKKEADKVQKLKKSRERLRKCRSVVSFGEQLGNQTLWERITAVVVGLKSR